MTGTQSSAEHMIINTTYGRILQPRSTVQYMAGFATPHMRMASKALTAMLGAARIPTKRVGSGFGSEADSDDIATIPDHSDFVLILHNSSGITREEFIYISNLSAPILLLHYTFAECENVNKPPHFFAATAALGMDAIATLALRRAGFSSATTLILPRIKENALRMPTEIANAHIGKPFTVIAPGDITPQNDAMVLIAGFAQFRQDWGQPSRLYLLGRTLDARAAKSLQEEVTRQDLGQEVTITGSLDREGEDDLLDAGDLCLLMKLDDSLLETALSASSRGLAVLSPAVPCASLALGITGLEDASQPVSGDHLATTLLKLAREPAALARLAAAQQEFRNGVVDDAGAASVLFNALGRCGLAMPLSTAQQEKYLQQLGFIVAGHFEGSYSIAAVNRMLVAALENRKPGGVSVLPVAHHQKLGELNGIPPSENLLQQRLFAHTLPKDAPAVVISQHFPPWSPDIANDLALSLFTWEETLVRPEIVETLNSSFAGVIAVSSFVAKVLVDSGVRRPVRVARQAVDVEHYQGIAEERARIMRQQEEAKPARFTCLHVSSCFPRKGVDVLLQAWAKAFTVDDDVALVIKTFPNPHQHIANDLERLHAGHPNLATVELIDRDLDQADLRQLYARAHCMVLPTRGEGFNMVAAEALLAKLPLIVTGFGGHLDFVTAANARLLEFRFAPSWSHVAAEGTFWVEPDLDDLVDALREAFAVHQSGMASALAEAVLVDVAQFDPASWAAHTANFAAELLFDPPRALRRIAWVSSWGVRCGIAEYSKELLEHRKIGPGEPEILLLCDTRTVPLVPRNIEGASVLPVWQFGGRNIASEIAPHLKTYDPQILIIQHQAGLISWEDLVTIIERTRTSPVRVIVFLHSTEAIKLLFHKLRATVLFGLALMDRVVVHTLYDLENLRLLGITENVTVLPHGATGKMFASQTRPQLIRSPILGCYGFFLPHKGIELLIQAFAHLLIDWPAARLRLVNAAFPSELSSVEIRACRALARQLSVDHAIEWHLDYLEEAESTLLLSGCDLIILPYDHTPESVSGAVRHALASGSPVAVSHRGIFDELGAAAHRVNAESVAGLYRDIAALLHDAAHCRSTLVAASAWLKRHDWSNTAKRLFDIAEGVWQLRGDAAPRRWTLTPGNELLENRIGRRTKRQLIFNGEGEEYGVYGPYADLAPGSYKVVFSFDCMSELSGKARFELVSNQSGRELAKVERTFPATNQAETVLEFDLQEAVAEVEFRVFCHAGFKGAFNCVSIELRWAA